MTPGADYPVNMIPYGDEALIALLSELVTSAKIGKKRINNVGCAFDTETSSFTDNDGDKVGLCYIWMFGIHNTVVYGRTLDEFVELVTNINLYLKREKSILYCYVHYLKYDFAFIKKKFKWDDVFIRAMREPLYARVGNIEFRDSLVLSGGQSLQRIGEKVLRRPVHKAVGDLNYDLLRTSETPLTKREMHYCEFDIRVLVEYIEEKIEDDGDITKIPYTNTGYVRNYVRYACFERRGRYMDLIDGLTLTPDCYLQCEKAFGGGAVGPNIKYVDKVVDDIHSYDIKSSYPYVMVSQYFPMGYFEPVSNKTANENLETLVTSMCCLFRLEIFNLVPSTDHCFPISYSKCNECIGARVASGRVITAAYVNINVTELDYEIYKRFYDFSQAEEVRVSRMRVAPRGFLPVPIVKSILKFFFDKTTLDGVPGKSAEYMIAKNMLNACYGMMVEKIVRVPFKFVNDFEKGDKDYLKQVVAYNEKRNRFLYYPWGVWVTAHARFRLYDAIWNIGDDWRYCDTDCVKFVGDHQDYFERVNADAIKSLADLALRLGMTMDEVVPEASEYSKTPHKKMYLGVWEHEYDALHFKTLGAKRYLVEYKPGDFGLTVAGTNKKKTLEYLITKAIFMTADKYGDGLDYNDFETATCRLCDAYGIEYTIPNEKKNEYLFNLAGKVLVTSKEQGVSPFDIFNENLVVPPEYAKRMVATFIDSQRCGYVYDYLGNRHWYSVDSGIHMTPSSYSFSITDEMRDAIDWLLHDAHYSETTL